MLKKVFLLSLIVFLYSVDVLAAAGCVLNNPDESIKKIFPNSTDYQTEVVTVKERGGKILADEVEKRLGDELDPAYESLDAPYIYYTVFQDGKKIGYVHGVNQQSSNGNMQIILVTRDRKSVV